MTTGSMVVARDNMVGTLYLITTTSNYIMENVVMRKYRLIHVKNNELGFYEKQRRVRFHKDGKDVFKKKMWIPKV